MFFLSKLLTCIPQTKTTICTRCNVPYVDTFTHFCIWMLSYCWYSGQILEFCFEHFWCSYLPISGQFNFNERLLQVLLGNTSDLKELCCDNKICNFINIAAKLLRDTAKRNQGKQGYSGNQKNVIQWKRPDMENRHTTTKNIK